MPPTLTERRAEHTNAARALHETAIAEGRPMSTEEQATFDQHIADGNRLLDASTSQTRAEAALAQMVEAAPVDPAAPTPRGGARTNPRDYGQAFIDSPAMASLRQQYPDGIPKNAKVTSGTARVGRISAATLLDPNLTERGHILDAPTGIVTMDLMQAITIVDNAPIAIDHHTATFTNVANIVAEGAAKPEATLLWSLVPLRQDTIAQHMPVTNQALNHNALLRNVINQFLVNGVRARTQAEVAIDLAAWAGLGVQAWSVDLRTTLRKAITKAQTNGSIIGAGAPSIIISALDAETLDLEQLANLVLSPGQMPQQGTNIWRAPLVVVPSMPSGFAYVGDPKQIIWYTTGDVEVSVGWVANQFIENEQTILAETEGVTGVVGAGAIIKADLTAL